VGQGVDQGIPQGGHPRGSPEGRFGHPLLGGEEGGERGKTVMGVDAHVDTMCRVPRAVEGLV